MHRRFSTLCAVAFTCQLCTLVSGQGAPESVAGPPWRLIRRPSAAVAAGTDVPRDGVQLPALDGTGPAPPDPPELTILPAPAVMALPGSARQAVRGVYAMAYSAGSAKKFAEILSFIGRTEVNALVIDVKDDTGTVSYPSRVPLAKAIGASRAKFDPAKVLGTLRQSGIYPIARIVTFKDPYLAGKRPDLAVQSKAGGTWRDRHGQAWVDPHSRVVWQYVVDVAKEAAALGFCEIQFDYVRFTSDGKLSDCVYPFRTGQSKAKVIRDFLVFAREQLKPLGVEVSADVFGLTCSAPDDLGIGQRIEEIATAVDIISPMVYPSHYYPGTYGISNPDLAPYETILTSLRAAVPRLAGLGVRLRPWLQDFSLKNRYGRAQLLAQMQAVYDAGLTEWIFWNPSNTYNIANYGTE